MRLVPKHLVMTTLVAAFWATGVLGAPVGPGDPAPDFTLLDVDNQSYTLSDFRGRLVLLALIGYG